MSVQYRIQLSADLGALLPPVGDMLKRVNDDMASIGATEKLSVRTKAFHLDLTSERELNRKEKDIVEKMILDKFAVMQPAWKVQVESFRRKSGNVQQSVS